MDNVDTNRGFCFHCDGTRGNCRRCAKNEQAKPTPPPGEQQGFPPRVFTDVCYTCGKPTCLEHGGSFVAEIKDIHSVDDYLANFSSVRSKEERMAAIWGITEGKRIMRAESTALLAEAVREASVRASIFEAALRENGYNDKMIGQILERAAPVRSGEEEREDNG